MINKIEYLMATFYGLTKLFLVIISTLFLVASPVVGAVIPILYIYDFKFNLSGIVLIIISSFLCIIISLSFSRIVVSSSDKWKESKKEQDLETINKSI